MDFVCTLASGSSGNAALLSYQGTHVLMDMGITYSRLKGQLSLWNLLPEDLTAVLVTHAHGDHVSGLSVLSRRAGVSIFASPQTRSILSHSHPELSPFLQETSPDFRLGQLRVEPFSTPHDVAGSQGYLVHMGSFRMAVATDLGYVPETALSKMASADYLLLEANFDEDLLRYGSYPSHLKARIFGREGHLSNDDCAQAAVYCVGHGVKHVTLCHLSEDNNSPDLALGTVAHALYESALDGFSLDVAPRYEAGEPLCFA